MTLSKDVKSMVAWAAPYLALFGAGTALALVIGAPVPAPAAGLFPAVVALRIGVMLSAAREAPGEDRPDRAPPARRGALHAARV